MGLLERLTRKGEKDGSKPSADAKAASETPAATPPGPPPPTAAPPAPAADSAPAATPTPEAATAPPSQPSPVFKELAEKINTLTTSLQTDRDEVKAFHDRIKSMEDRMKSLNGLSELVSMRYNPFLEDVEEEMFDGKAPKLDHANGSNAQAPPAVETPPHVDVRSVGGAASAPPADTSPALESPAHAAPPPASVSAPSPQTVVAPPRVAHSNGIKAVAEPTHAVAPLVQEPRIGPGWSVFAANPRTSYLALAWFDALVQSVGPRALHPLLDYYRDVGWLSPEVHSWLDRLASGVVQRPEGAKGTLPTDAHKLLRLHMSSLRFFDYLFRANFAGAETAQLEAAVRKLVQRR